MTETSDDAQAPTPRRPPAPPSQWATVTALGARRDGARTRGPEHRSSVDGSLALAPGAAPEAARGVPDVPELRLVAGGERGGDDLQVWAARFAQAVVEVLGGDRPIAQLLRWTSHRVYLEIERRLSILNRTTDAGRRMRTVRPQVRSVHVFHPTPASAEVSVHVRHGQRSRAIAARLERRNGRWQCTALQLG
ncbi:MAG TPA: Rv3235 family protein [Nocardioidaceae bacterium]|nr:Rv3235 family protein [Nocardioidaceae bacterium]